MSEERIVYGVCDANCRVPVYSREQILAILQQTIDAGSLQGIDPAESPVVRLIRESRADKDVAFWVGTEAQYNEIAPAVAGAIAIARIDASGKIYFCTDDTTFANWQAATLELLQEQQAEVMNAFDAEQTAKYNAFVETQQANYDAFVEQTNNAVNNRQAQHTTAAVTLSAAGWGEAVQTVNVPGVTANNTVIVAPAAESQEAYTAAGVKCTAQGGGTLTFACVEVPVNDMTVNVVILGV